MAMSESSLSGRIEANLIAAFGDPADAVILKKHCDAVAKAVVDEIQQNAVVSTAGTVNSGVGAGGATTATGTVT